jgi:heavy metal translocating P-type ATPase
MDMQPAASGKTDPARKTAEIPHLDLSIEGMTCAACVRHVERALKKVPGVAGVSVNLATERARVDLGPEGIAEGTLEAAVADAGYAASRISENTPPGRDAARDEAGLAAHRHDALIAAALAAPVIVLEMGGHLVPAIHDLVARLIGHETSGLVQFLLTTLVMLWPGRRFYRAGIPALARLAPDMNSLVAIGTLAAWGYSSVALFLPRLLPEGAAHLYFEAAAVIIVLILAGRWLEARSKGRTGSAIRHLLSLAPREARVRRAGGVETVPAEAVLVGDIVEIRPGERLPVDGVIIEGETHIDEAMITGEPLPVKKSEGDAVTGGTVNASGSFAFRATRVGAGTVLAEIVRMVETAQGAKLPIEALVDRVTAIFVPAVLAIAVLTFAGWMIFAPSPALGEAMVSAVAVLIIACPCAMGLATPVSIMVATGRAAELGVLFRRGEALQSLADITLVALDKTGTLTEGRPALTDLEPAEGFTRADVLRLVAALEVRSEHPIAHAIVAAAKAEGLVLPPATEVATQAGLGIGGMVERHRVEVGGARHMAALGIETGDLSGAADRLAGAGKTPVFAAIDGSLAALIAIADPVRPTTPEAIRAMHVLGLRVAMLTGDAENTAKSVGAMSGIDEVHALMLPEAKLAFLKAARAGDAQLPGAKIAFVGDGINDAPALAEADAGIAIGTGTDVAIESADIVLMSGDLNKVPLAIGLSRATMRNIRQNLFWAFAYNAALIPVAAGLFYPTLGIRLSPILGAGAMALSSVFVLTNALRLRRFGAKPAA